MDDLSPEEIIPIQVTGTESPRASLATLPVEVQREIIAHLFLEFPRANLFYLTESNKLNDAALSLIPLASTSHSWRDLTLPYVFRYVTLNYRSIEDVEYFAVMLAPRYGCYCRVLRFSTGCVDPPARTSGGSVPVHSPNGHFEVEFVSISRTTLFPGHRRWSSALASAASYMPLLDHVTVYLNPCPFHKGTVCRCLSLYKGVLKALASAPVVSLHVDFFACRDYGDGSEKFVSTLLKNFRDTLTFVHLNGDQHDMTVGNFVPRNCLSLLASLTRLEELSLSDLCSCADVASYNWQSPLRSLSFQVLVSTENVQDFSATFAVLPCTLQSITWNIEDEPAFSSPFPSHLTELKTLVVGYLREDFINYLRPATFQTLVVVYNSEPDALFASVETGAFPNLTSLTFWEELSPGEAAWRNLCSTRSINLTIHKPFQDDSGGATFGDANES